MRNRLHTKYVFVFVIAMTWSAVTYLMFLNKPNHLDTNIQRTRHKTREKLKQLEYYIDDMKDTNGLMFNRIKETSRQYVAFLENRQRLLAGGEKLVKMRKYLPNGSEVIPVVVIACNRVTVKKCLDQLLEFRPDPRQFPIIVSQDCNDANTREAILNYGDQVTLIEQPDQSDIAVPPKEKKFKGYFKISRHYGWALNQTFFTFGFDSVIIVEDDLDIAPDFFEYFLGLSPLLQQDPSLWCISAWNDNGKMGLIHETNADKLYRTDFFPGLGWMLRKNIWMELAPKWAKSYWDDWIRKPEQRRNRACIRPEVSRTKTFGKIGVSNGMFYEKHLKFIKLNQRFVPFTKLNLTYLLKNNYDQQFVKEEVYGAEEVSFNDLRSVSGRFDDNKSRRLTYRNKEAYRKYAKMLGLMDDFRSGVPRTGYRGIVTFFYRNRYIHLAPPPNWNGYDVT